jgi:hypothetical protein
MVLDITATLWEWKDSGRDVQHGAPGTQTKNLKTDGFPDLTKIS